MQTRLRRLVLVCAMAAVVLCACHQAPPEAGGGTDRFPVVESPPASVPAEGTWQQPAVGHGVAGTFAAPGNGAYVSVPDGFATGAANAPAPVGGYNGVQSSQDGFADAGLHADARAGDRRGSAGAWQGASPADVQAMTPEQQAAFHQRAEDERQKVQDDVMARIRQMEGE